MRYVTSGRELKRVPNAGVRKSLGAAAEQMPDRCVRFTISTDAVDRQGDRVMQDGWLLDNYLRNPVVLFGHDDSQPPVGRCLAIGVEGGALKAVVEFLPRDVPVYGERAEAIYQMVCRGFLSATSVGFRPVEWEATSDPERGAHDFDPGADFHKAELVEFSIVPVPCNPEALVEAAPLPLPPEAVEVADADAAATGAEAKNLNTAEDDYRERMRLRVRYLRF